MNVTERRLKRISEVLGNRQPDLTVICENIHDPHNVSAIYRSCDAVGIEKIHLLYNNENFPFLHPKVSASGRKWIDSVEYSDTTRLGQDLKSRGYTIYATHLSEESVSIYDIDWTKPSAIVLGNEHRGVSDEILEIADQNISIPMFGMIKSLNVSVATAVILFEACRQRIAASRYPNISLSEDWLDMKKAEWLSRKK